MKQGERIQENQVSRLLQQKEQQIGSWNPATGNTSPGKPDRLNLTLNGAVIDEIQRVPEHLSYIQGSSL